MLGADDHRASGPGPIRRVYGLSPACVTPTELYHWLSHPDPATRLNAALQGRYRVERQLGEGGMATVASRAVGMLDTRPITIRAPEAQLLTTTDWQARSLAHLERAQRWTLPHKERRSATKYTRSTISSSGPPEYRAADGVIRRDPHALSVEGRDQLSTVVNVLSATQSRPANFGCYGVHEWAMIYRGHDIRHAGVAEQASAWELGAWPSGIVSVKPLSTSSSVQPIAATRRRSASTGGSHVRADCGGTLCRVAGRPRALRHPSSSSAALIGRGARANATDPRPS